MKKNVFAATCFVMLTLGLSLGCGDEKPSGPILGDFAYPLQVGQQWKYIGRQYNFNFVPESLATNHSTLHNYTSTVQVMEKTKIIDSVDVYSFRELAVQTGMGTYETWHYYNNRLDGFYLFAHGGTNAMMLPRKIAPESHRLVFHGKPLEATERLCGATLVNMSSLGSLSDSLTGIDDPPIRSLMYPLSYGSEWVAIAVAPLTPINKKVIEKVSVQVPAGIYTCAKIQWLYDLNSDGSWDSDVEQFDYVSQIGLIKRTKLFRGVTVTTFEHPEGIGVCDVAEVWELSQSTGGQ